MLGKAIYINMCSFSSTKAMGLTVAAINMFSTRESLEQTKRLCLLLGSAIKRSPSYGTEG